MPKRLALAIADLHLSLTPPACRAEEDWLEVQARYLNQVKRVAGDLPILCAGDIFDRWNPVPELIHFALEHLPDGMLCVPGQHDLPHHRLEDMHRSGYGVLVKAGKIKDISSRTVGEDNGAFWVRGFGWGQEIKPLAVARMGSSVGIALIHRYCWTEGSSYPGAPAEARVPAYEKMLKGYDVAIYGDNHKGFQATLRSGTVVCNCGGFLRRKSDEIDYQPCFGIIYEDRTVHRMALDTTGDRFHADAPAREASELDLRGFLSGLEGLGEHGLNFREAVENHLRSEDLPDEVKEIILRCLENKA